MFFKMALNHSYIQTIAELLQANIVLILKTITHNKRRTNELMNLLASVSVTSPQKGAKKMRKKRNRSDFGLGRGKLVKGGRIS